MIGDAMKAGDRVRARPGTITRIVDGFIDRVWTVETVYGDRPRPTADLINVEGERRWEWVDGLELLTTD